MPPVTGVRLDPYPANAHVHLQTSGSGRERRFQRAPRRSTGRPGTGEHEAHDVAERLRAAVSQVRDPGGGRLTISLGTVTCVARCTTADQLLAAADGALYAAKQAGRNRTVAAAAVGEAASAAA